MNISKEIRKKIVVFPDDYVFTALCGAMLEDIGYDSNSLDCIRKSLNGITNYYLPISESALSTKQNWRIYEPTRK